jgi:hypothetical protein
MRLLLVSNHGTITIFEKCNEFVSTKPLHMLVKDVILNSNDMNYVILPTFVCIVYLSQRVGSYFSLAYLGVVRLHAEGICRIGLQVHKICLPYRGYPCAKLLSISLRVLSA